MQKNLKKIIWNSKKIQDYVRVKLYKIFLNITIRYWNKINKEIHTENKFIFKNSKNEKSKNDHVENKNYNDNIHTNNNLFLLNVSFRLL